MVVVVVVEGLVVVVVVGEFVVRVVETQHLPSCEQIKIIINIYTYNY